MAFEQNIFVQLNQELVQETYHSRITTTGDSSDEEDRNKETFDPVDEGR